MYRARLTSVYCLRRLHEGSRHLWEDWAVADMHEEAFRDMGGSVCHFIIKDWPEDQHEKDRSNVPIELYNDQGGGHYVDNTT